MREDLHQQMEEKKQAQELRRQQDALYD